jgi:hypothetical protein
MGGISYNVWLRGLGAGVSWNHATPAHWPRNHTLYTTHRICILSNSEGSKKLPDDGRLLLKDVGASI